MGIILNDEMNIGVSIEVPYFEKAERHNITHKSGTAESQTDYILSRSSDKSNMKDGKFIMGKM